MNNKNDSLIDYRARVLNAALMHVPSGGWNMGSFCAGASDVGFKPIEAYRAFPGGILEATRFYSEYLDQKMLESLSKIDLESLRIRDRVIAGVRARIEAGEPNREAIKRLASYFVLSGKNRLAIELTWKTCDAIWYAAGDTAADFNFYTKRGLLFPVYSSTLLVWLVDESSDHAESWSYLERKIARTLKIPRYFSQCKKTLYGTIPNRYRGLYRRNST